MISLSNEHLIFFIFVNTKKEYFTDVKRHDQDEILSTNYQIQNYKIEY